MARFYVTAQGNRGETSRQGSQHIEAHPRGWSVGVRVFGKADGPDDVFDIWATGGSRGAVPSQYLGSVRLVDGRPTFVAAHDERSAAA